MKHRKITYKLYPTSAQQDRLLELKHRHKTLYNAALEERIDAYRKASQSIGFYDQSASLSEIRAMFPDYRELNCTALQQTLRRLNKAFAAFFRRCKEGREPGFPRFKSMSRFSGITYGVYNKGRNGWRFMPSDNGKHGRLYLSDVGTLKARGKPRQFGELVFCELCHRRDHWYLSLTVECEPRRESAGTGVMAFDWGVTTLLKAVDNTGQRKTIDNPRWFQSIKETKAELQRQLAKKKRFSRAWKKSNRQLAALESKMARKRLDFQHKLAADIASQYVCVAAEKLSVKNMTTSAKGTVEKPGNQVKQKAGLNREIIDTAPAQLYSLIQTKVKETAFGVWLDVPTRKVKPSQRCPKCWQTKKKTLSERVHLCSNERCGYTDDRDFASSLTSLRYALAQLAGREPSRVELPPETLCNSLNC